MSILRESGAMLQTLDTSRTVEEEKADEFSEIVRSEVRSADGFADADETNRDALFLVVAQKFMEEDGGFMEADGDDAGPETGTAGEMIPALYKDKIGNSNVLVFGYMPVEGLHRAQKRWLSPILNPRTRPPYIGA